MTAQRSEDATNVWSSLVVRSIRFRNRLGLAPMSQYQSVDGYPNAWHLRHYCDRAHGLGLVMVEATAIADDARVTPWDLVLNERCDLGPWRRLTRAIRETGAVPGVQLSHAGRKASRSRPWEGDLPLPKQDGGWQPAGPTDEPFGHEQLIPRALSGVEVARIPERFARSAARAVEAGFGVVELHAGHGRLLHSFYSPISNRRIDEWGGERDKRCRLLVETVKNVRMALGSDIVIATRLSCTDWVRGGWTLSDSVWLASRLAEVGCDVVDCSSGGIVKSLDVPRGPGYQVDFARSIRIASNILTAAVGELRSIAMAQEIIAGEKSDLVFMGRKLLLDPFYLARFTHRLDFLPLPYRRALARQSNVLVATGTPEL